MHEDVSAVLSILQPDGPFRVLEILLNFRLISVSIRVKKVRAKTLGKNACLPDKRGGKRATFTRGCYVLLLLWGALPTVF